MVLKCDVLVIGAGPSGATCSSKLAKEGFEVICIDKAKKWGEAHSRKIDITENKGIEHIIKELKSDYLAKTNKSVWFSPNNKFTFVSSVHDLFFLRGPSKDSLDYSLFLAMKDNGVDIWFNSEIEKHDFGAKGKISSVIINRNGKKVVVEPKIVVAADGPNSKFLHLLGITQKNPVTIAGFGALMEGLKMENNSTSIFFDSFYAPGGYFFVGKVSNEIGIAMVVVNKKRAKRPLKEYFDDFIAKNPELFGIMLGAKVINFNSGECTASMISKRVVGNVALCGDAARVMSPVFAYGVNPAMKSGYLLAESIKSHGLNEKALKHYEVSLKKSLGDESQGHFFRGVYDKLTNPDFDFLVESANYLHSKQHLDELVDEENFKLRHIVFALLRKPHKTIRIGAKAAAKALLPFY
ncbi:MAG: NAD(P)/FAD-dependent oxidoreductase [archaeon]|jgi:flavin-dependent dehydrogenase